MNPNQDYRKKIYNFILENEKDKKNINILEFGVREGRSTKMFLELCARNNGKLISVDIDNYSNLFQDKNWKFIHCRDDDYKHVSSFFSKKFDIILIDSLHEPNHVQKLIYTYWKHLNVNCSMYIDDISWLPYIRNLEKDNSYAEINNLETFQIILEIYLSNRENFDLEFNFEGTGICKIKKKNNNILNQPHRIRTRDLSIKNLIRKIIKR